MERIKPILFSTPMVQAILAGRKTQTRRVVKPSVVEGFDVETDNRSVVAYIDGNGNHWNPAQIAPYQTGDILWVRETWRQYQKAVGKGSTFHVKWFYAYRADEDNPNVQKSCEWYDNRKPLGYGLIHDYGHGTWRPSIFMPCEAARLFLRVTDMRVKRVQEGFFAPTSPILTLEAEGIALGEDCEECLGDYGFPCCIDKDSECGLLDDARSKFADLWDSLNAKRGYGWAENPWVWVYEFERIEKPPYI